MPWQAAAMMFGGLAAAAFFLWCLNRLAASEEVLDENELVKEKFKKTDEPPHNWTGWEG